MKIYQIDSSARKKGSTSRALAKKLLAKIKKPKELASNVDLLVFCFKRNEKDQTKKIVNTVNDEKNATRCYAIGSADSVESATISKWFQKKN